MKFELNTDALIASGSTLAHYCHGASKAAGNRRTGPRKAASLIDAQAPTHPERIT